MFLPDVVPWDWLIGIIKDEQMQAALELGKYISTLDIPDEQKRTLGMLAENLVKLSLHLEVNLQNYNAAMRQLQERGML